MKKTRSIDNYQKLDYNMDKSEEYSIRQRIDELKKAIKRDPKGQHSNVDRRERELEDLKEKLK